jgi:DNA-binding transcriptional MerR regulator
MARIPLTDVEAAEIMGLAVQTLRNWRQKRKGPPYYKLGRRIVYYEEDLIAYIEKFRIDPEAT